MLIQITLRRLKILIHKRKHGIYLSSHLVLLKMFKEMMLQTHKMLYELFQMDDKENICDFFIRVTRLMNQTKVCGKEISIKSVVVMILRSLSQKFDYSMVTIGESKELSSLTN